MIEGHHNMNFLKGHCSRVYICIHPGNLNYGPLPYLPTKYHRNGPALWTHSEARPLPTSWPRWSQLNIRSPLLPTSPFYPQFQVSFETLIGSGKNAQVSRLHLVPLWCLSTFPNLSLMDSLVAPLCHK